MSKNHYETLGIPQSASAAEIKKAYKKLAMQWHPDRHQGDKNAEERFKSINEAYQILGDADKKKQYDTFGSADFGSMGGGAGGQGFGGFDFADIFGSARGGRQSGGFEFDLGDLFGSFGQTGRGQSRTGGNITKDDLDITKSVELPIWDLLTGTKLSLEIGGKSFRVSIPACTKPHTKLKISGKGRTHGRTTGDLYLRIDARMPDRLTPEQETKIRLWREQP